MKKVSTNWKNELRKKLRDWHSIPKWLEREKYPLPGVSMDRWAWEFLKRNAEFRREVEAIKLIPRGPEKELPPEHPIRNAWRKIQEKWGIDFFYLNDWVAENPDDFDAPCRFETGGVDYVHSFRLKIDPSRDYHIVASDKEHMVLRFNLSWPIAPQVAAAARHLNTNQDCWESNGRPKPIKSVRAHAKKFPMYLRVFDARNEKIKVRDIADQFSKEKLVIDGSTDYEKAVTNAYAAAKAYVNGDYRLLPMTQRKAKNRTK